MSMNISIQSLLTRPSRIFALRNMEIPMEAGLSVGHRKRIRMLSEVDMYSDMQLLGSFPLVALSGNAIGQSDERMRSLVGSVLSDPNQQTLLTSSKSTTPII
jgi:hypothetical protein